MSCFDDKRFFLDDGVHTLAYFDKDCNKKDLWYKKRLVQIEKDLSQWKNICDNNDNDSDNNNDNDNDTK